VHVRSLSPAAIRRNPLSASVGLLDVGGVGDVGSRPKQHRSVSDGVRSLSPAAIRRYPLSASGVHGVEGRPKHQRSVSDGIPLRRRSESAANRWRKTARSKSPGRSCTFHGQKRAFPPPKPTLGIPNLRRCQSSPTIRLQSQNSGGGGSRPHLLTRHNSFHPTSDSSSVSPRNRSHTQVEMPDALARWKARRTDPHTQKLLRRCDSFNQQGGDGARNKSHSFHSGIDGLLDGHTDEGSSGESSWEQWRVDHGGKAKAHSLSPRLASRSLRSHAFTRQLGKERTANNSNQQLSSQLSRGSQLSQGSDDWGHWVGDDAGLDIDVMLDELMLPIGLPIGVEAADGNATTYTRLQLQGLPLVLPGTRARSFDNRSLDTGTPPLHRSAPSGDIADGVGITGVQAAASTTKRLPPNLTVLLPKEAQLMYGQQQEQQQQQQQQPMLGVAESIGSQLIAEPHSPPTPTRPKSPRTPKSPHEPMTPNR
jgi:hypothetical protein